MSMLAHDKQVARDDEYYDQADSKYERNEHNGGESRASQSQLEEEYGDLLMDVDQ